MKQLLCYGDSNTWGLIPNQPRRYPWGVRWTSILQEKLGFENVRVIEEGLCGRTTMFEDSYRDHRNGLKTLSLMLESHTPLDAAVIMLGTNDCKTYYGLSAQQIAKGMEQCVQMLLTVLPAEKILLMSPIFLGENVWKAEYDPEFNPRSVEVSKELQYEYRKLAEEMNVRMIAASDHAVPSEADQEHMLEEGHKALAEAVYLAVKEMID